MPEMRAGDWLCPACNNHNYADKVVCNKCKGPKVGGEAGGSPYILPQGGGGMSGGGGGGGGRPMRPGDWLCPSCSNHNYADKVACNKCGIPKAGDMYPSMMQQQQQFGGGKGCGYGKAAMPHFQQMLGQSPYLGGPCAGGQAAPKGGMRPGDWMCPACSNHNYADKVACNRCQAPKTAQSAAMHPFQQQMQSYNALVQQHVMGGMQAMGAMRPGDWACRACQNINYASRDKCNKCQVPKDIFISKSGMRPGDWVCPACNNHNWADKIVCVKCSEPKGEANVHEPKGASMRPGDWICTGCQNHNYQSRVVCNRCQAPIPIS